MDLLGSCQVCGQYLLSDETSPNLSTTVPNCQTISFAGSDGSTAFNEHLRFYFVTRKLLHFPESQCLKFMTHMIDSNDSKSLLRLCDKCKNIVDEAAKLHMQLAALQYQIDKLSDILKRNVCRNKSSLFLKEAKEGEDEGLYPQSGTQPKVEVEDVQIDLDEGFDVDNFGGHFLAGETGDDGGDDNYEDSAIHDSNQQEEEGEQSQLEPLRPTETVSNVTEKRHQCELCESTYATLSGFRKHLRIHEESEALGNKFDCPRCRHPNLTKDALKCHITQLHEHAQKTCNICGHVSYKPWLHENHMLIEHNVTASMDGNENQTVTAEKEIFSCELCASEYTSRPGFNKHKRFHEQSNLMGNKFDCQICRHPCLSKNSLAKHLTRSHPTNEHQKIMPKIEAPELGDQTGILQPEEESFQNEKQLDEINMPIETRPLLRRRSTKITSYKVDNDGSDEEEDDDDIRQDTKKRKKQDKDWESEEDREESASASPDSQESESESDSSDSDFEIGTNKRVRTVRRAREASSSRPKGDFICSICNNTYSCDRSLSRHMELHDISRSMEHKYDCKKCGFPCNSENKLRYHKRKIHQEIAMLCCPICPYEARRPVHMRNHMKKKHNVASQEIKRSHKKWSKYLPYMQPDGKFKCPSCESVFTSSSAFCRHLREHDKTKLAPESFDCEECGFPCLSENKLQRHRTKVHSKPKSFKCNTCNRSFKRPFLLQAHMQTHKQFEKSRDPTTGLYHCFLCKTYEGRMQGLIVHLTQAHPDYMLEGSSLCSQCGQSFTTEAKLKQHIKNKHENIYRFRCETCFKGFDSKNTLKNHKKTHEEVRTREFICDACGTAYSHSRTLANHVARFHPELSKADKAIKRKAVKKGQFKCKWCDMVFTYKYLLVSHMPSAHKDLYTFSCDLCSRTYISASSLKLHKEINHSDGSRSFSCKYCQKTFTHKHYVICHYNYCREKKKLELDGSSSSIAPDPDDNHTNINNQNLTFEEETQRQDAIAVASSSNAV